MIESNENLCEYEFFLVRNLKTGTNWFNQGHQDSIPKTRNVPAKPRQLECLSLMDTAGKKKMQVKRQLTDPKVMTLGYGWHLSDRAELSYLYIYIYIYIHMFDLIDWLDNRKWNQLNQFRWTSAKAIPMEKVIKYF